MKYLILGSGWYGCFLGMIFKILGLEFKILEKNSDIFTGSSSKNQNRLHLGFHYPRSKETRMECINGYNLFNRLFNFMTIGVLNNYYLVDKHSNVSYNDYVEIYKNEGYKFTEVHDLFNIDMSMNNVEGIIKCDEKIIKHNKAYDFFKNFLKDDIIFDYDKTKLSYTPTIMYDNQQYDYLIDCTYGQGFPELIPNNTVTYELCISLIYNSTKSSMIENSVTLVDGNFFSIYPYDSCKNQFTVTDVEHTPLFKSPNINDVVDYESKVTNDIVSNIRKKMESKINQYMPTFNDIYQYDSYYLSYKCKFKNTSDDRSLKYFQKGNIISFIGGKITGIFSMIQFLFEKVNELNEINKKYLEKDKTITQNILNIFSKFRKIKDTEINHHSLNPKKYSHVLDFIYEIIACDEFRYRYVLPIMKIAVLFFGFTRDIDKHYPTHSHLFTLNPDIFIHTYDSSGKKAIDRYKGGKWISDDELDKKIDNKYLIEKYKPKKIIIDKNNLDSFSINDGKIIPVLIYQAHDDATKYINSQLYSKYSVCKLKRDYESENNIKYDIVFLMRFDFGVTHLNINNILGLDMSRIYFPSEKCRHKHPGGGGGCLSCDNNKFHFGCSHTNDICDLWTLSASDNIDIVGKLYLYAKKILRNTRYITYDYIVKNNIKYKKDKNFIFVYENFEHEKIICYYPERLLREYLTMSICVTYNHIHGAINK
ncbi:FAD/NAD(P)-binding domain superfamily protein [Fadolivirus algeromassiliense]|jgi:hypothetical protein|uniref:FAD/NAD(P)-binding domain superfamily protein n=1 Tax=Fadolivirus FV1/VV64 TaxID=3070911 RepID=A0A7D3UW63_9VIRU|nr:FAD/NAD(P)-binding domain superfamily protein [Fadolivirus algeromassiliense]QKF94569.1 FAD/NAD(P)-binding domain superfamily protein [Fadolivirus FV1/VV64]